jgi:hypothetical protein
MSPDPYSAILGTGYERFLAPSGCHGLAKINGQAVEILAVGATEPGKGQFRAFISDCKRDFAEVRVLEIWNPDVSSALTRYGFVPFTESRDLEVIEGMAWPSPIAPMPAPSGGRT